MLEFSKKSNEVWKPIAETNGKYLVSSSGNIYSEKRKKVLEPPYIRKPTHNPNQLNLFVKGKRTSFDKELLLIQYFPELYPLAVVENLFDEKWLPVVGHEELYSVSNKGRVKAHHPKGEFLLIPDITKKSYRVISLSKNGKRIRHGVHNIMAKAFLPNPENKPEVNHIDANPENNHLENLEWITKKGNAEHCVKMGRRPSGSKHAMAKLKEEDVIEIRKKYVKRQGVRLAKEYNISIQNIMHIVGRHTWKNLI